MAHVLAGRRGAVSFLVLRECIFGILLLAMAWVDWRKRIIPNGLLLAGIINWAAWTYLLGGFDKRALCVVVVSAIIPSCVLILVLFLEKRKGCLMMGGGDVKLMFVMSLYMDWLLLLRGLLVASVFGVAVFMVLRKGKDEAFPFGPFLAAGYLVACCLGSQWPRGM